MLKGNQELTEKLVEHLQLGKPLVNRSRKAIGQKTAKKYRLWLRKLDGWLDKPFSKIEDYDIDQLRKKLKEDKIRDNKGQPYSDSTKRDIEQKILKVLLNFLNKPQLALYNVAYKEDVEIPAISRQEVEKVVNQCKLRDKVIFQLLFDGGFRAEEFLNVQFKDIKTDSLESQGYYKVRITKSKTLPRTVGLTLPLSTEVFNAWMDTHRDKVGTTESLVDISYVHLNLMIRRQAFQVLNKKLTPHMLRHSSATYYCHLLNQYQMCKRYGWSMSSDMPRRYIDREGVDDEAINNKIMQDEAITFKRKVDALQEQLNQKEERMKALQEEFSSKMSAMEKNIPSMIKELMSISKDDLLKAKKLIDARKDV